MLANLNDVLYDAQKNHYGVGLFNTTDSDMLEAVISEFSTRSTDETDVFTDKRIVRETVIEE